MDTVGPEKKAAAPEKDRSSEIQLDEEWLDEVKSRKRGDAPPPAGIDTEYLAL